MSPAIYVIDNNVPLNHISSDLRLFYQGIINKYLTSYGTNIAMCYSSDYQRSVLTKLLQYLDISYKVTIGFVIINF